MSILNDPIFHDEHAAYACVESILWPHGPVCDKCGCVDSTYELKGKRIERMQIGLQRCRQRKSEFTAKVGTVKIDETFIGNGRTIKLKGEKKGRGCAHKHKMLALVDRSSGRAWSMVVDDLNAKMRVPILRGNIAAEVAAHTASIVIWLATSQNRNSSTALPASGVEDPSKLVRSRATSASSSGAKGVYRHCAKKHLHRYKAEFEFRYNNGTVNSIDDFDRVALVLHGIAGKRILYRASPHCHNPSWRPLVQ